MMAPPASLKRSTHPVADVPELADIEIRIVVVIQGDQVLGIDFMRIFSQGHVGHVEQPADLEIVRKLVEIFREMLDRLARAGGLV